MKSGKMDSEGTSKQVTGSKADSGSKTRAARETVTGFETADLTPLISSSTASTTSNLKARSNGILKSVPVETSGIDIQTDALLAASAEPGKKRRAAGIPSWLLSMIVHCSLITSLALVSISGGGRNMVDLIATSEDAIKLSDQTEVDLKLETPELVTETTEIDVLDNALTQTEELAAVLEESMVEAAAESDSQELYESVASAGLSEADLPNRLTAGSGANFFGIAGQGANFIFIVDCSGSMGDFGRWKQAKKELKNSINGLNDGQKFLILLYNQGFIAMNKELKLVHSTSRERRKALRWLSRNRPDSLTYCAEALQQALALRPDAVFLLSDGEFNDRDDVFIVLEEMNDKARLQRLNRQQTPVHTVALGSHLGKLTMEQIASENSGVFRLVN